MTFTIIDDSIYVIQILCSNCSVLNNNENVFDCPDCNRSFTSAELLFEHARSHNTPELSDDANADQRQNLKRAIGTSRSFEKKSRDSSNNSMSTEDEYNDQRQHRKRAVGRGLAKKTRQSPKHESSSSDAHTDRRRNSKRAIKGPLRAT